jgi:hypothetical protein
MVFKKLFPQKNKSTSKESVQANLKNNIHKLEVMIKDLDNQATLYKLKAKKYLKMGNKDLSRANLIKFREKQNEILQYNAMREKLQKHLDAHRKAEVVSDVSGVMETSAQRLDKVAEKINPEKASEITELSQDSMDKISEASELLAGDLESESGVDIEDEFAQLETEVMLEEAGKLPDTPEEDKQIEELEAGESEEPVKSKEKIKDEIAKLKKELDLQ